MKKHTKNFKNQKVSNKFSKKFQKIFQKNFQKISKNYLSSILTHDQKSVSRNIT